MTWMNFKNILLCVIVLNLGPSSTGISNSFAKITNIAYIETDDTLTVNWEVDKKEENPGYQFQVKIISEFCPDVVHQDWSYRYQPLSKNFSKAYKLHMENSFYVEISTDDGFDGPTSRTLLVKRCPGSKVNLHYEHNIEAARVAFNIFWIPFTCNGLYEVIIEASGQPPERVNTQSVFGKMAHYRYIGIRPDAKYYTVTVCSRGEKVRCYEPLTVLRESAPPSFDIRDISILASLNPVYKPCMRRGNFEVLLDDQLKTEQPCLQGSSCEHDFIDLVPLTSYGITFHNKDLKTFTPTYTVTTSGNMPMKDIGFFHFGGKTFLSFKSQYSRSYPVALYFKVVCYHAVECKGDGYDCAEMEETTMMWPGVDVTMTAEVKHPSVMYNCTSQLINTNTKRSGTPVLLYENWDPEIYQ